MKELIASTNPKKIKHIQFGLLSSQDVVKISEFEVTHRDLYTAEDRLPVRNGPLDRRLGTVDKSASCETCGHQTALCVGHYAYIKLVLPVFHIGYFKHIIGILQDICKSCARVLLDESDRRTFLKRFRRPNLENLTRMSLVKQVNTACRKVVYCPYCGSTNGTVKKAGLLRIVHEKFRAKKTGEEKEAWKRTFGSAIEHQKEVATFLAKAHDDLNPLKVLDLFKRISAEDCELLGLNPVHGRPEHRMERDDITVKLSEIVYTNAIIKQGLIKGVPTSGLMEQWDFLQVSIAMYINSETPGIPPQMGMKPMRGFCQRLKGKQGRFRGNLSGKRVDFSGRTVISPDPNLAIDEVAVPVRVAKILTYPTRVTAHNISQMKQAVINGADIHPGANYLQTSNGFRKYLKVLKPKLRIRLAEELKIGDLVDRHIVDGDVVLFNRQPSLHKLSIMCHRAKIRPWRTFRLNECVCGPYGADFDGDEMNMHVPQTEEARAEASILMSVRSNIVTPRNGEPIISAIQDFITASFLLSSRDRFFDRRQFSQICSYLADANLQIDIPPPTIIKPIRLWTGKQIFNVLMKPNKASNVRVNVEARCSTMHKPNPKYFPSCMTPAADLSPNDGWLVIVNSEIMCGVMDKATVGSGKKKSIFGVILRDYGANEAANTMGRLAKLCARWLTNIGFSLGINDVIPGPRLRAEKDRMVEEAYAECLQLIEKAKLGKLENKPGCNQEQTLEAMISGVLSKVRGDVGDICMKELSRHNAPIIMATCGSKGSTINVSQMVSCVGQQIISGKRVPDGFQDRSLPHFPKKSKEPPAKGFVRNSFFTGLLPTEFLFHAISGREGLVDTAVKTAETGYMQRRLMKALEDLTTQYDLSVRNSVGGVVQFTFGDDGLDPACLEGDAQPVDYLRAWSHSIATGSRRGKSLYPYEVADIVKSELTSPRFKNECTDAYIRSIEQFIRTNVTDKMAACRDQHGMFDAVERSEEWDDETDLSMGAPDYARQIVDNVTKVTEEQLRTFLNICWAKYAKARIEPGSTVGAVGAQSIGEPGTQMTLKTFHFAGVASMNVTLGVPRIKEIINASKAISTPIITCRLVASNSETSARIVKGRLEKTYLGDIASVLEEAWGASYTYVGIHIDMEAIQRLQLDITLDDVKWAILNNKKLKVKEHVRISLLARRLYLIWDLELLLSKAIINVLDKDLDGYRRGDKELLVEGYGLKEVMNTDGIIGEKTTSNHIMEVEQVLGIEAARQTIIGEIQYTMQSHGMNIDPRHIMLLGDVMTYKGQVLGITRFGVAKMKDSVLMLASFEKTTDHLFDAAGFSKKDSIAGVSESIIMGNTAEHCGTSMPSLIIPSPDIPKPRELLFEGSL
ncbi:DNA-directed RNA polymerase III subunit C5 [Ceratobasidium sp. AG-Ba]|nr:DNA-directed RNA polymerase III subunit C5 [Ceratobasidium sp. AG-Ba]